MIIAVVKYAMLFGGALLTIAIADKIRPFV